MECTRKRWPRAEKRKEEGLEEDRAGGEMNKEVRDIRASGDTGKKNFFLSTSTATSTINCAIVVNQFIECFGSVSFCVMSKISAAKHRNVRLKYICIQLKALCVRCACIILTTRTSYKSG